MKFCRIKYQSKIRVAALSNEVLILLSPYGVANPEILEYLSCQVPNHATATKLRLSDVEFLTPISRPGKIMCLGLNYITHAKEGGFIPPDYPTIFMRCGTSLTSHNGSIKIPACSNKLDFEGELAIIIGKTAYNVSEDDALKYVAGYSIFNDGTLRDYQKRTSQWIIGKNFDQTGGFGPCLVTPDELPEGAKGLKLTTRLNGQIMQSGNTIDMIFSVAKTIALITECMTLEPGDVIATGTPEGVGYVRTPPIYMKEGDICEVDVEGLGTLANRIGKRGLDYLVK